MSLDAPIATAILGIDTLWGGDVLCPSGTGRFIADSWFSDAPLPSAYTHSAAVRLRQSGGVSAKEPDRAAIDAYLAALDIPEAIAAIEQGPTPYLNNLGSSLRVMWDLAREMLGSGDPVPYARCVAASTGAPPEPSQHATKREQVAALLEANGYGGPVLEAVERWREARLVPMACVRSLGASVIAKYDQLCAANLMPYLPPGFQRVPRANIRFLAIPDAWFSGSMNYLGRARRADGSPEYEATYEINASLKISVPEFEQLVTHEVVPGHVTTFAYLQNLYVRGEAGFEATVLTMNTRSATLFEGIANNALLMALGVTEVGALEDDDLKIGLLLALLQDDAKNQASYLTWGEGVAQPDVQAALRRDFLVSEERAAKLSGTWGQHPLLGRMYLPAYRAGTEKVAELRRKHAPEKVLPALFGVKGLVDITTIDAAIGS